MVNRWHPLITNDHGSARWLMCHDIQQKTSFTVIRTVRNRFSICHTFSMEFVKYPRFWALYGELRFWQASGHEKSDFSKFVSESSNGAFRVSYSEARPFHEFELNTASWDFGLIRRFVVYYRFIFSLVCILTRPAGSPKYSTTRKNIQLYFTPKHVIIWLATRADKMNQILRRGCLPARSRWSYLTRSGLPVTRAPLFTVKPYSKSFIGQACSVKMELSYPLGIARYPRAIINSKAI